MRKTLLGVWQSTGHLEHFLQVRTALVILLLDELHEMKDDMDRFIDDHILKQLRFAATFVRQRSQSRSFQGLINEFYNRAHGVRLPGHQRYCIGLRWPG